MSKFAVRRQTLEHLLNHLYQEMQKDNSIAGGMVVGVAHNMRVRIQLEPDKEDWGGESIEIKGAEEWCAVAEDKTN